MTTRTRHPAMIAVFVLPVLLLLAAVLLGVVAGNRGSGPDPRAPQDTRPLALPPVEAPDATSPSCARLLAALPGELAASPRPLPRLALADPAPDGAVAWAGSAGRSQPVVLRCGLPRPAELTPAAALLEINGVRWLTLSEPDRDTFLSADRPVYLALTVPRGLGSAPVQTVANAVRAALPPRN